MNSKTNFNFFVILLIAIGFQACNGANENIIKKIKFEFFPSFSHDTEITIDYNNKTLNLNLFEDYYIEPLDDSDTSFPYIVEHGDTLITFYNKTFPINESSFKEFQAAEKMAGFTKSKANGKSAFDGVGLQVSKFYLNNDSIILKCRNPDRTEDFIIDYKLLDAVFGLSYLVIDDDEGIAIIENLHRYFDYEHVRFKNRFPLEVRVFSGVKKGCRIGKDYLESYLKKIPEEVIIFDCRDGFLSSCLYEPLSYIANNREIYFYGENKMTRCFQDVILSMDTYNSSRENFELIDSVNQFIKNREEVRYSNWINNKKIKWFERREDVMNFINNKTNN